MVTNFLTALDEDANLVNTVQRHTHCSPVYTLYQAKANQQQPTCRLGYPKECTDQTDITFEQLSSGDIL